MTAPRRKSIPLGVKLAVALRALGVKESEIDWSHEPALGLRAINEDGTDYVPPQLDPEFIFIRKREKHDEITFKDNGTGRGDLTAIAHVKRSAQKHADHMARMDAKASGDMPPEPRRKVKIPSRPFPKARRPMRSRSNLGRAKP